MNITSLAPSPSLHLATGAAKGCWAARLVSAPSTASLRPSMNRCKHQVRRCSMALPWTRRVQPVSHQRIHQAPVAMALVQRLCRHLRNQVWEASFSSQQTWGQRLRRHRQSAVQGLRQRVDGKEEPITTTPFPWVRTSTRISAKVKRSRAKKTTACRLNRVLPFRLHRPNQVAL